VPTDTTTGRITVIVPAFNEAGTLAATIHSLRAQTLRCAEILVVDDCSTDETGDLARALGVRVVRPPVNSGSKAGAQTFGLRFVTTPLVVAIDADTTLAPDALEHLAGAFNRPDVAAACGFVVPRHVGTVWERGRYIEYLFTFSFYKQIQDYYERPLIASGCLAMYRTDVLRTCGGWSARTLAEDMDLTWTLYANGHGVRFVPEAVCYPIEPHDFTFLGKQLRRWSHGFVQNVRLHRSRLLDVPYLRSAVVVAMWDAAVASVAFLLVLPALALMLGSWWPLVGYVLDGPAIAIPVLAAAARRREFIRALISLPAFFVLRTVNAAYFLRACWQEVVLRQPLLVYEKGH
jgi:biofilm PGA synthesis N-glycosyltransferase PgaC